MAATVCPLRINWTPQFGKCASWAVHHKKDRSRLTTNDFCSALALDACCMQTPMKRKVCWFLLCFSFPVGRGLSIIFVTDLFWEKGRINPFALVTWRNRVMDSEMLSHGYRAPLLISASSLFCMNVSCQGTMEIKMVVCISCRVAVALLAFFLPCCLLLFIFLVWGSHKKIKKLITNFLFLLKSQLCTSINSNYTVKLPVLKCVQWSSEN